MRFETHTHGFHTEHRTPAVATFQGAVMVIVNCCKFLRFRGGKLPLVGNAPGLLCAPTHPLDVIQVDYCERLSSSPGHSSRGRNHWRVPCMRPRQILGNSAEVC